MSSYDNQEYLTTGQVARVLGLSRSRVIVLSNEKVLDCSRTFFGFRIFKASDVFRYLNERSKG